MPHPLPRELLKSKRDIDILCILKESKNRTAKNRKYNIGYTVRMRVDNATICSLYYVYTCSCAAADNNLCLNFEKK